MRWSLFLVWLFLIPASCAPGGSDAPEEGSLLRQPLAEGSPEAETGGLRVAFLGTSLTEGLGLANPEVEAWPATVGALAREAGTPIQVVNAGVSGETSAGALRRVEWVLRSSPRLLVVETGANDGLRGLSLEALEENLDEIMRTARSIDPELELFLVGMEAPPNMGQDYAEAFRMIYPRVAERWGATLIPFERFLGPVAGDPTLNQADRIHPTAEGHRLMAEGSWSVLKPFISTAGQVQP